MCDKIGIIFVARIQEILTIVVNYLLFNMRTVNEDKHITADFICARRHASATLAPQPGLKLQDMADSQ